MDYAEHNLFEIPAGDVQFLIKNSQVLDSTDIDEIEQEEEEYEGENCNNLDDSLIADLGAVSLIFGVTFGRFDVNEVFKFHTVSSRVDPFAKPPSPSALCNSGAGQLYSDTLVAEETTVRFKDLAKQILPSESPLARTTKRLLSVETRRQIQDLISKEFFKFHIRQYTKNHRKSPIYWQLATPSGSYSVWLYLHAFTKDTLYKVQDYAALKFDQEERALETLKREIADGGTSAQRTALAEQEDFVEELRNFLGEVKRVAPLWNPNLDDGVLINFAPLWRLVPQHKAWQKELKMTWDALCAGDDDWAHLAMHLWPERVVPKCTTDRSLAIAHNLEDVFWFEGDDGKWKPRKMPTRTISELVAERSSEAVKAALKSLVEAPDPTGAAKRGRKSKVA